MNKCHWFLLCNHPAVKLRGHPILGGVPICQRCDDKIEALERQNAAFVAACQPKDNGRCQGCGQ